MLGYLVSQSHKEGTCYCDLIHLESLGISEHLTHQGQIKQVSPMMREPEKTGKELTWASPMKVQKGKKTT